MTSYTSTRGAGSPQSFTAALLSGMAPDGGLYLPEKWPTLDIPALANKSYAHTALQITRAFIGDDINDDALEKIIKQTYAPDVFDHQDIAPLVECADNTWLLELFHGPTLSFKDYALQLLGRLFDHVLKTQNKRITIVGATSGDTGSAAIEACRHSKNIDIFILHPRGRTSDVQRKQMTTIDTPNVHNIAIEGTFDDCQALVKALFADEKFRTNLNPSAVNSINWARIMAQIIYYVSASTKLGTQENPVSFTVPTGNFGNVFAAWAARSMAAPIGNLTIASNRNDILTRFFETGSMIAENVVPSLSPSMDIQISSNFERYLFELTGRNAQTLTNCMNSFSKNKTFILDDDLITRARNDFHAHRCDDAQTLATMKDFYTETGMLIDPHTAVGVHAARQAGTYNNDTPSVIVSTAHPAKFPDAVKEATGITPPVPERLAAVLDKPERFDTLPNSFDKLNDFIYKTIRP